MLNKFKPKSEFSRNVLTLMTGTTIAQAIPIAISPILTRIYTPENFGVFALFIAISSIFGSIANGRYELAIMLPKKDEDAINIFALGFIITCVLSLLLLFLIIFFHDYFIYLLGNDDISIWLYFVPISVFFIGSFNILNYFNTRKKYYKDIANTIIIKSIITAVIQLGFGLIKSGVGGLVSGQLISQIFANMRLLKNIIEKKILISSISKVKIIALSKRYKDFPKFSILAILANTLSFHLTNILISSYFSLSTLGFYSLVQRLLGMPSSLIGNSIGQVFFQEASKEKEETGKAINSFTNTLIKLLIIGIPSFGILFFIVEDLFAFVFGEKWRQAGIYAKIILPLFLVQFIVRPLMIIDTVFEKQKFYLTSQIFYFIMIMIILYLNKNLSFDNVLYDIMVYSSVYYLVYLYILNLFAKGRL